MGESAAHDAGDSKVFQSKGGSVLHKVVGREGTYPLGLALKTLLTDRSLTQVITNAHTLTNYSQTPLGIIICPTSSLLNHSCAPNTVITFSGRTLNLHALDHIEDGEELTINYVDTTNPTNARQEELRERYFFACHCQKCTKPELQPDVTIETQVAASRALLAQRTDKSLGFTFEGAGGSSLSMPEASPEEKLGFLNEAQKILDEANYPRHVHPSPSILNDTILIAISAEKWPLALKHALRRDMDIDPFIMPQAWHPVRVIHSWVLLKLIVEVTTGYQNRLFHNSTTTTGRSNVLDMHTSSSSLRYHKLCQILYRLLRTNAEKSHGRDSRLIEQMEQWAREVGIMGAEGKIPWSNGEGGDEAFVREELTQFREVVERVLSVTSG